jgi:hypothetical protein
MVDKSWAPRFRAAGGARSSALMIAIGGIGGVPAAAGACARLHASFFAWVVAQKTTPRFVKNRGVVVRPLAVTYSRMA